MDPDDKDRIETVQVAVRIRPLVESEIGRGCETCLETVPGEPQIQVKGLAFTYNYVFPPEVGQRQFYDECIGRLVRKLYKGYNVTVLAYGQTGSGKTHSMGTAYSEDKENAHNVGVIPRAVSDIFSFISENEDEFNFKVTVSFMELYQEQLYDLLSTKPRDQSVVDIREDPKEGITLRGLTAEEVKSVDEIMARLVRGSEGRATGSTAMNSMSSRSHAIFTVHLFKQSKLDSNQTTISKFHLVDLAGSERSKKTKATGNRFKEGVKINQGLLALGNVISALGDGSNRGFVCYRDSKLTRLLQDSLGGNSVTLMIACVSPADFNLEETVSTLRYADRAKQIKNKPIINQDPNSAEIVRLNNVIQQLRLQIFNEGKPQEVTDITKRLEDERIKYITLSEKYDNVVAKNKNLTQLLHKALSDNTHMVESAILAEAAKEKIDRKLAELNEGCNQTIELLKANDSNLDVNKTLDNMYGIRTKINDLQSDHKECNQIISKLVDGEEAVANDRDTASPSPNLNETEMQDKEEAHAMDQVARNDELKNLIKSLSEKKILAEKLHTNNQYLITYNESMQENEQRIQMLEKDKQNLLQQLKMAQTNKLDPKTTNETQKKVQALEIDISKLKKKCTEQANLIKMKEKNDGKILTLNNEIQQMKAAKVRLIKAMRSENDKFRTWKLQHEKQIAKLSSKDRKMQSAMVRMENKYTKEQYVLKRKMEDAVATNKRLKEAMERQKNAQKQRKASHMGKAENVHQWVDEEVELICSLIDAKQALEELMKDRAILTDELETLKMEDPESLKVMTLQGNIQLRCAQIADLQQKILDGDQENKVKLKVDTMQSMIEAKFALKYLFDLVSDTKAELLMHNFKDSKYDDLKKKLKDASDEIISLEKTILGLKNKQKIEILKLEKQHEEKLSTLIKQLSSVKTETHSSGHEDLLDRIAILEEAFENAKKAKDKLMEERLQYETTINKKQKAPPKNHVLDKTFMIELEEDEDSADDSMDDDPDWEIGNGTKLNAQKKTRSFNISDENRVNTKRSVDGVVKCGCNSNCTTKKCSCRKLGGVCGPTCKCDSEKCKNQTVELTDLSNAEGIQSDPNKTPETNDIFKKRRTEESNIEPAVPASDKKKRNFFYPDKSDEEASIK